MKKIIISVVFGLILSGTAFAEEMVVQLTSGNAVVIQYTGTIEGVTLKGTTDGIAGVSMPHAASTVGIAKQQSSEKGQAVMPQDEKKEVKTQESGIRFKWAEPIQED